MGIPLNISSQLGLRGAASLLQAVTARYQHFTQVKQPNTADLQAPHRSTSTSHMPVTQLGWPAAAALLSTHYTKFNTQANKPGVRDSQELSISAFFSSVPDEWHQSFFVHWSVSSLGENMFQISVFVFHLDLLCFVGTVCV